jgi:hypothetical protein
VEHWLFLCNKGLQKSYHTVRLLFVVRSGIVTIQYPVDDIFNQLVGVPILQDDILLILGYHEVLNYRGTYGWDVFFVAVLHITTPPHLYFRVYNSICKEL